MRARVLNREKNSTVVVTDGRKRFVAYFGPLYRTPEVYETYRDNETMPRIPSRDKRYTPIVRAALSAFYRVKL